MTVTEILDEVKNRAVDPNLQNSDLLVKINNEYDQTNLAITNLNEDYFLTEEPFTVTDDQTYLLPEDFAKMRVFIAPSGILVPQVSPADPAQPYGWYFAGSQVGSDQNAQRLLYFTDTPREQGDYTLRYVAYPPHLDTDLHIVPLWPAPFHEILVLGALKRLFSVQDLYDKYPDLDNDLQRLRETLLAQVGGLNLGTNRDVDLDDD